MAKDKKHEPKIILEREYIVPLRREVLKVPLYRRGKKAIRALKEFIAQHMKIYDRDLRKVKIDIILNNEIRFRGMKRPPTRIKVLAKKYDNDTVRVELVNIPEHIKYLRLSEAKLNEKIKDNIKKNKKEEPVEEKVEDEAKVKEAKENEESAKIETLKIAKDQAKEAKHVSKIKETSDIQKNIGGKRSQKGR
jgi:large subunit ribosomal protein L31e